MKNFCLIKQMMDIENIIDDVKIVGISTVILDEPWKLLELHVDVLVLQFSIHQDRAIHLLTRLSTQPQFQAIKVVCLFEELDSDIIHLLLLHDIQNFLIEPCDIKQLLQAIRKENNKKETHKEAVCTIETKVSELMIELGLPAHLNGFSYIRTSSLLIYQKYAGIRFLMGNIYKETAGVQHTTAVRVEKSIRTAIKYAYRTQPERICIYNTKPTASQVILYISERLKQYEEHQKEKGDQL